MSDDEERWHVRIAPGEIKLLTLEQIDDLFRLEMIDENTLLRENGSEEWLPLRVVAGLDDDEEPAPPTRVRTQPGPPPQKPTRSQPPPAPARSQSPPPVVRSQPPKPVVRSQPPTPPPPPVVRSQPPTPPTPPPPPVVRSQPPTPPPPPIVHSQPPPSQAPTLRRPPPTQPPPPVVRSQPPPLAGRGQTPPPPPPAPLPPPPLVEPFAPSPSFAPPQVASVPPRFAPPLAAAAAAPVAPNLARAQPARGSRSEPLIIGLAAILGLLVVLHRNGVVAEVFASAGQGAAYDGFEAALGGPGFGTPRAVEQLVKKTSTRP